MTYWIFVTTKREICDPKRVLEQRVADRFWGFTGNVRYLDLLAKGDKVVFYVGKPYKYFAAIATLATGSFELDERQQKELGRDDPCHYSQYGVFLEKPQWLDSPRLVKDIARQLEFIINEDNWQAYFQGSIREISEKDFLVIVE